MRQFRAPTPPALPFGTPQYAKDLLSYIRNIAAELERYSNENDQAILKGFVMTNKTVSRALDCDTATTAQVADVLASLIDDLRNQGY